MFDVKDKVALITGAASGIGLKCAIELLKNGLKGITLVDINEEFGDKALKDISKQFGNNKVIFLKVDITNKDQFEDAFKETVKKFNNIDILINNAGVMNDQIWETEIDVNIKGTVTGTLLGIQNYIHKFKSGAEGVIVNISSVAGTDPTPPFPVYSATKHAIIGLTRSFGTEMHYDISGVRIFAICPGATVTPLLTNFEEKVLRPDYLKSLLEAQHLIIHQDPEHVARYVVDLIKNAPQGSVWVIDSNREPFQYSYTGKQEVSKVMSKML